MIMAIRRIAVEEAFVTPEIMAQWHVVLAAPPDAESACDLRRSSLTHPLALLLHV